MNFNANVFRVIALATALTPTGVFAQQHAMPAGGKMAGMADDGKHPMAMHSQMMADMKTMDAKLDRMIASMNAATGTARVDAMAAVINEMASQRKEMMMKMTGMEGQMMEHMAQSDGAMKGMHNMDPKAPGAKK